MKQRNIDELIGKTVKHFKGDLYLVLGTAINTETEKEMVIYKALYDDCKVWIRDKEEFMSEVPENKQTENVNNQLYRFEEHRVDRVSTYRV